MTATYCVWTCNALAAFPACPVHSTGTAPVPAPADPFEGWFIDEADPDVGIFGDAVIHEACAENVDGDEATTDVSMRDEGDDVIVTTTFTCPACSATTSYDERQPREWFGVGR